MPPASLSLTGVHLPPSFHSSADVRAPGLLSLLDPKAPSCRKFTPSKKLLHVLLRGNVVSDDTTKLDTLAIVLNLLTAYATLHKDHQALNSMFAEALKVSHLVPWAQWPQCLQGFRTEFLSVFERDNPLVPLTLQAHKPVPIAQFDPDFQEFYSKHKSEPDREKREQKKLKAEYKKEMKGAVRELRKDSRYIATVQQTAQTERDEERRLKVKSIHSDLSAQQGESNSAQREKEKAKSKKKK